MSRGEDGLEHGWDRADAAEWSPVPASTVRVSQPSPEPPAVRVRLVVLALVMIVVGAVLAIAAGVPDAFDGADLLGGILAVSGIILVLREVRR